MATSETMLKHADLIFTQTVGLHPICTNIRAWGYPPRTPTRDFIP